MAGIEKICEYSGEYEGLNMYSYKRNHIQIIPKYRKLFRKKAHELIIFKPELRLRYGKLGSINIDLENEKNFYEPPFKTAQELKNYLINNGEKFVLFYDYLLIVKDIPGNVDGHYYNHSYGKLGDVKRRLKRMLACKRLNIKYSNMTIDEYYSLVRRSRIS